MRLLPMHPIGEAPNRYFIAASLHSTRLIFVEKPVEPNVSAHLCAISIQGRPLKFGDSYILWEFHYWEGIYVKEVVHHLLEENFVPYIPVHAYPGWEGLNFYDIG
jgi:hypothetical protein